MSDMFPAAVQLTGMTRAAWVRRASLWCRDTRFAALPLLAIAVWSQNWLGLRALVAVLAAGVSVWLFPRLVPPFRDFSNREAWGMGSFASPGRAASPSEQGFGSWTAGFGPIRID